MAKQNIKKKTVPGKQARSVNWTFPLERKNLIFLAAGLGTLFLGYALMFTSFGAEMAHENTKWDNPFAITFAPLVLTVGYCILIPMGLMKKFGPKKTEEADVAN